MCDTYFKQELFLDWKEERGFKNNNLTKLENLN